jgi:hypothetical protein
VRNAGTKVTATVVKWVYRVDHQLEQPVSKVCPRVEHGDAAVRGPGHKKNRFGRSADYIRKKKITAGGEGFEEKNRESYIKKIRTGHM